MKLLLDTHLLVWAAERSPRLSPSTIRLLLSEENQLYFSAVSIWEIAIKVSQKRHNLKGDARALRRNLLANGYTEIPILSEHAVAIDALPPIHHDPFDRLLIAQAIIEDVLLLTADTTVARYLGPIRKL
jgi:PIN domain nuclease of toxin-antitoxin system